MAITLADSGHATKTATGSGTLSTISVAGLYVATFRPVASSLGDAAFIRFEVPAGSSAYAGTLNLDPGAGTLVVQQSEAIFVQASSTAELQWEVSAVSSSVEWYWQIWRITSAV